MIIEELAKQVPSLIVLAFIVVKFLKYLENREVENRQIFNENNKLLGEVKGLLIKLNGKHSGE